MNHEETTSHKEKTSEKSSDSDYHQRTIANRKEKQPSPTLLLLVLRPNKAEHENAPLAVMCSMKGTKRHPKSEALGISVFSLKEGQIKLKLFKTFFWFKTWRCLVPMVVERSRVAHEL